MSNQFLKDLQKKSTAIEKALKDYIADIKNTPQVLVDAMKYSLNAGGKRLRPALVMMTAECFGLNPKKVIPCAAAVEMIHTYSLIHDDLPCMDNDSLRRGKPTNHKIFGTDLAMLAGDALLTYAFEIALENRKYTGAEKTLKAINYLAYCVGASGMVGGQVSDIYSEGLSSRKSKRTALLLKKNYFKNKKLSYFLMSANKKFDKKDLLYFIHSHKTAELIKASAQMGAALAGVEGRDFKLISQYGRNIGMAFQITDDILDAISTAGKLGKSASDKKLRKLTFVTIFGLDKTRKKAKYYFTRAKSNLNKIKITNKKILNDLADFILKRTY